MTSDPKIQQILNRFIGSSRCDNAAVDEAPQHLQHLNIEKMRSVKRLRMQTDSLVNAVACCRP